MALKEAALNQAASQAQQDAEDPAGNTLDENVGGKVVGSALGSGKTVDTSVSTVITDEVLRHRIRTLIEEKPKPSRLQSISAHPLFVVFVSFLLSVPVGGLLTYLYSAWQQEAASQRSFADELNRIRIQKIGEVWEQVDKNEVILDDLLDKVNKSPGSNQESFERISSLIEEDIAVINKNRFWLGERAYKELKNYLDITGQIVFDMLLGQPGIDLSEPLKRREQAKQNVLHVRNMFSKGEPEPSQ